MGTVAHQTSYIPDQSRTPRMKFAITALGLISAMLLLANGDAKTVEDRGGLGYKRAADPNVVDNYVTTLEANAKEGINGDNAVIAAIASQEEDRTDTEMDQCMRKVLRKCFKNLTNFGKCMDVNKLTTKLLRCLVPETRSE